VVLSTERAKTRAFRHSRAGIRAEALEKSQNFQERGVQGHIVQGAVYVVMFCDTATLRLCVRNTTSSFINARARARRAGASMTLHGNTASLTSKLA